MRNWNSVGLFRRRWDDWVFIVPMRNWNFAGSKEVGKLFFSFLSYLWGIETRFLGLLWRWCWLVFIVPMRNWNLCKIKYFRFLTFVFIVPMRNWNGVSIPIITPSSLSFYRTYEELKQLFYRAILGKVTTVFIVPMRNWNLHIGCVPEKVF